MKITTDYMRVKVIRELVESLDECVTILRRESEEGNLYSGLQADVIATIVDKLRAILDGQEVHI